VTKNGKADPSLEELFVSGIVRAGGVYFAADVLRTRAKAERFLATCYPAFGVGTWVPILQQTAKRIWELMAARFGLKECSNKVSLD
jgi:hypothetical protein